MSIQPLPIVFVGCSNESIHIAKAIQTNLSSIAHVELWTQGTFKPSHDYLDDLLGQAKKVDFAVFILSPDDITESRNSKEASPRDNIVFESGFFMGALGRNRVFLLAPKSLQLKKPTDLSGITMVLYTEPQPNGNWRSALGAATNQIEEAILEMGQKPIAQGTMTPSTSALYQKTYSSLQDAANDIKDACKNAMDLKILSITGVSMIGTDNSIISTAELESYTNVTKLRVLLMSTESRWVTSGLAARRERNSLEEYVDEIRTSQKLVEIGLKKIIRRFPNVKSGIRYFTGEPNFRMIMTEKTAFVSNYVDDEQRMQSRDLPVYRFDRIPGSFYSMFHRRFNDIWHNESKVGNYLIPIPEMTMSAGGIVYSEMDKEIKIIVLRRFDGNWVLPKGHKIREDETINMTALREIQEETGLSPDNLLVEHMLGSYADNGYADEHKEVFIYLIRFTGSNYPELRPDPDHAEAKWVSISEAMRLIANTNQRSLIAKFEKMRIPRE